MPRIPRGASELDQLMEGSTAGALNPEIVRRGFQDPLVGAGCRGHWRPAAGKPGHPQPRLALGSSRLMLSASPHDAAARQLFKRAGLRPTMVEMRIELPA